MKKEHQNIYINIITMVLGAVLFLAIYGINVLNPTYDDWLLGKGDLTQHYLGWCFYRRGDWTFPIGLTNQLAYPTYTSVIFTDSIPLLAVLFKVLSPILPDTFQYFGWWGLACFMLQGYFAVKILREFSVGKLQAVFGSVFFIVAPVLIERMFRHTALGGHWIILASIYLFAMHRREAYRNVLKTSVHWGIVGGLTASVHLYFLPMCGMFLIGYILCSFIREKRVQIKYILPGITFSVCLFGVTYILGGFSSHANFTDAGLGDCSFNLNGLLNSKGYSRIFNALPIYTDGQYEGFAYLGLGILILLLPALFYFMISIRKINKVTWLYGSMYLLISIGLIIFAASPVVSFNDKFLFRITDSSTLTHYWSIFRSTGRIIWPVCYLIYIGVIIGNDRLWNNYIHREYLAVILLVICCSVQIFDISLKLIEQNKEFAPKKVYGSILKSEIWDKAAKHDGVKHVVWVSNSYENKEILHFAKYAYDNNLTMNNYYFARGISVRENTQKSLDNLNDKCIYIFKNNETEGIKNYNLNFYEADEYIVGTTFALE